MNMEKKENNDIFLICFCIYTVILKKPKISIIKFNYI